CRACEQLPLSEHPQSPTPDHPAEESRLYKQLDGTPFEYKSALVGLTESDALNLLDVPSYYRLQNMSVQTEFDVILDHFLNDRLIISTSDGACAITNLGALLYAKNLAKFSHLARKSVRVIKYKGRNKIYAEKEQQGVYGYATGFEGLMNYISGLLPSNEHIESALRVEVSAYPMVVLRELVANALIHQDFSISGTGPLVEIYEDRIEISNPGAPLIDPNRFVDAPPRSRNEKLAYMMRRSHICEERGSGWDRIAESIEFHQLPAPSIRSAESNTIVTLSSPKPLSEMDDDEKVRAVYLHSCLQAVSNQDTNNKSIRNRFGLTDKESQKASSLIKLALDAKKIVPKDPDAGRKLMKYLPYWAGHSALSFM
ncbi:MAG: transcriptional regulator, partial [Corynebacterium casei]|uniref:ATP-binding protein n=1 Tax=Corynebacterium casei TaxID=160386 RepID=UPI00264873EF